VRIGIDACCWSNRRGFGRFTRELVTQMVTEFPAHEFVLVADRDTAREGSFPSGARVEVVATLEQPTRAASASGARSPLDLWRMARAVARLPLDAFFFPAVYSYFPLLRRVPTAITFHDAIAESYPHFIFPGVRSQMLWRLKTWLARRQADRLITVSESARAQVAAAFRVPASAIHVITEGPHESFRPLDDRDLLARVRHRYHLPAEVPLLLYVGGISPHKNLQGLLQAIDQLRALHPDPWHVALVGDHSNDSFHGCYRELTELTQRLALGDRVTFTGYVPNDDLVALYNTATLMVLPSFCEGFGLPVVEAMACGTPVAASRAGSLPEVLGPAGLLFDPAEPADMAAALLRLVQDSALRRKLREEGLQRVERFSWRASAHAVVRLLEGMVHGSVATA
jgi:glycosyltransferase involved in cell wall biosynthesis